MDDLYEVSIYVRVEAKDAEAAALEVLKQLSRRNVKTDCWVAKKTDGVWGASNLISVRR